MKYYWIIKSLSNISKFDNDFDDSGTGDFVTGHTQDHGKAPLLLRVHF